jgi:hypothetical protein
MTHALKTWPEFFIQIESGEKNFEIRKNDRPFGVGDKLLLQEYEPDSKTYTGNEIIKRITCIVTSFGVKKGWVILGIDDVLAD